MKVLEWGESCDDKKFIRFNRLGLFENVNDAMAYKELAPNGTRIYFYFTIVEVDEKGNMQERRIWEYLKEFPEIIEFCKSNNIKIYKKWLDRIK